MLHKQVAVTDSTVTDLGQFAAIAATWSVDRTSEQIRKGAFAQTIEAWRKAGKAVPVHWNHRGEAENVIGSVDAESMAETDEGLFVQGQLDLSDSDVAREAWRSMKANRIALSFGYLVTADRKRDDGIRELLAIDLFEITLTPSPANPETRILEMKGKDAPLLGSFEEAMVAIGKWGSMDHKEAFDRNLAAVRDVAKQKEQQSEEDVKALKAEIERRRRRSRPVQVKSFDC